MKGKHYTAEDDQTILCMANKGASNQQIAAILHRTPRAIGDRRSRLRMSGWSVPISPRNHAETPEDPQLCITDADPYEVPVIAEEQVGEIDPIALLRHDIDALNAEEKDLQEQLDAVRANKFAISTMLCQLLESLSTLELRTLDPMGEDLT